MPGTTPENPDDAKGRAKQATGKLTGDKKLQREGKTDQAAGKIKGAVDKLKNKSNRKP